MMIFPPNQPETKRNKNAAGLAAGIQSSLELAVHACPMKFFRRFLADESKIALDYYAVVNGLGSKLNTKFEAINTSLR
jgi:Flp pilus assembly pilin Flp